MDKDVILSKIESLERCVRRVEEKTPLGRDELIHDLDRQDIIILNLERAVQLSVDIAAHIIAELQQPAPMSMAECFSLLQQAGIINTVVAQRMRKSVGFRNIAVHEYRLVDWGVVYAIITEHLEDFVEYARQIHGWMERAVCGQSVGSDVSDESVKEKDGRQ